MSELGLGVMINMLFGNQESHKILKDQIGKKIKALSLEDDQLKFEFEDGDKIRISDKGQSCCESRYMTTDDDLSKFIGSKLLNVETREVKENPDNIESRYGECHEIEFLIIQTSDGSFTVATHNEHNGYYGGFWIECEKGI